MKVRDLEGQRFGRLQVICRAGSSKSGRALWECVCDCGSRCNVTGKNLSSEITKSCGCLRVETQSQNGRRNRTHGHGASTGKRSSTYGTWFSMKSRCLNPNDSEYARYGAKGITLCKGWETFSVFLQDMGEKPSKQHSIDRIDNTGNYEPSNCRWATWREQNNNQSVTRKFAHNGEILTVTDIVERYKLNRNSVKYRLCKQGMTVAQMLGVLHGKR